jgi:glucan endo-1,3-alpha-glucosidase
MALTGLALICYSAVSPWFSTHFNTKNWVFICEEQPTIRWEQMLAMKPELIEIITWNGECKLPSQSRPTDHGKRRFW